MEFFIGLGLDSLEFVIRIPLFCYPSCSEVFQVSLNVDTDIIDIVRDPISSGDYRKEEDPKLFCSAKTNRGPLDENWRENYTGVRRGNKPVMTAYKLCRVEFKYWGMQNKIERFIHDVGENLSCAFWCYVLLTSLASEMSDWLATCFPV